MNSLLMFACIFSSLGAVPKGACYPSHRRGGDFTVEEYFIEHEVTGSQAKNASNYIAVNAENKWSPGCQSCTDKEMRYCLGQQLVNDHCCCDKRYQEFFPYVPHTCYLGPTLCKTIANDCAEYARLRTCCCDISVLKKWKGISSAVQPHISAFILLFQFLLHLAINY